MLVVTQPDKTARAISSDAELRMLEAEGKRVHDYDLATGEVSIAFDGTRWLVERPDLGPHTTRR